ncbi:hypothetical protein J6590_064684 [Homalodisca vitripennis]|nr:hypothetical protein J6590_064684 [Homalodisca vitripennis]
MAVPYIVARFLQISISCLFTIGVWADVRIYLHPEDYLFRSSMIVPLWMTSHCDWLTPRYNTLKKDYALHRNKQALALATLHTTTGEGIGLASKIILPSIWLGYSSNW